MTRIKSLKELGKGSWKIVSITPVKANHTKSIKLMSEQDPQTKLFNAVVKEWPEAVAEHPSGVPGRKFRLDIAFVDKRLCIEMDGWQWHAKHLADFKRDRRRQNLLVMHGWRVLRFTAADVHRDLDGCLNIIRRGLEL